MKMTIAYITPKYTKLILSFAIFIAVTYLLAKGV
ncbi:MAG: hypothetical protein KatS3mg034_0847 [Vicingaceae bacterium]|nr:MAG: hypothetical protein KatS3mg034_0847 [Vicingaceae bacterium]